MRRSSTLLFGIVAAAICGPASAADLPRAVQAALAELLATCTAAHGTPHDEHAVQTADLNGDGAPDFVLYAGWIVCEHAWNVYGDREKTVRVFAARGRDAEESFAGAVYDARLDTSGTRAEIVLTVSGPACGKPRADSFAGASFCERALVWNARTRHFEYQRPDAGPAID